MSKNIDDNFDTRIDDNTSTEINDVVVKSFVFTVSNDMLITLTDSELYAIKNNVNNFLLFLNSMFLPLFYQDNNGFVFYFDDNNGAKYNDRITNGVLDTVLEGDYVSFIIDNVKKTVTVKGLIVDRNCVLNNNVTQYIDTYISNIDVILARRKTSADMSEFFQNNFS